MSPQTREAIVYNSIVVGLLFVFSSLFFILTEQTYFVKEWQTLISAFIALAAAAWTVQTMRRQIKLEQERHADARTRKSLAAIAHIPDSLEEICEYLTECFEYVNLAHRKERTEDYLVQLNLEKRLEKFVKPTAPKEAISALKTRLEYLDGPIAETAINIVMLYQIFNTRFARYLSVQDKTEAEQLSIFKTLIKLYSLCLTAFEHLKEFRQGLTASEEDQLKNTLRSMAVRSNAQYGQIINDWEHYL